MILVKRPAVKNRTGPGHCDVPRCFRSASVEATFLGAYRVLLCAKCAKEWGDAYDHALYGWDDKEVVAA